MFTQFQTQTKRHPFEIISVLARPTLSWGPVSLLSPDRGVGTSVVSVRPNLRLPFGLRVYGSVKSGFARVPEQRSIRTTVLGYSSEVALRRVDPYESTPTRPLQMSPRS